MISRLVGGDDFMEVIWSHGLGLLVGAIGWSYYASNLSILCAPDHINITYLCEIHILTRECHKRVWVECLRAPRDCTLGALNN